MKLYLGASHDQSTNLLFSMANRHGLIAGATGTGKSVTLQTLAEGFSTAGVPVFLSDIKGDLSGLAASGGSNNKVSQRIEVLGLNNFNYQACPCLFWDLFAETGHPIRATLSDMGPQLLARVLKLNDTQSSILHIVFKIADDEGLLLLDTKDLTALLNFIRENSRSLQADYGNLSPNSLSAIQRKLLALEQQGATRFFGEPQLDLQDLMKTDFSGNGVVSILDARRLVLQPRLYAIFLLWLIAELFEELPEVGDLDKPKLVFFFDEAHLLFDEAPKELINKIEQVVRLIRSKGVGLYFVTQNPVDIPVDVLSQLGNRIQHALRAYTPKDQKAVKAAADTFRENPAFDTGEVITQLAVGEALVSMLNNDGVPDKVERVLICPPRSQIGPLAQQRREELQQRSPLHGRYEQTLDRESAYELLSARHQTAAHSAPTKSRGRPRQGLLETMAKSAARSMGRSLGRQLVRGLLGSLLK